MDRVSCASSIYSLACHTPWEDVIAMAIKRYIYEDKLALCDYRDSIVTRSLWRSVQNNIPVIISPSEHRKVVVGEGYQA